MASPVTESVNPFRDAAQEHAKTGGFGRDSAAWFEASTARIDELRVLEERGTRSLVTLAGELAGRANSSLLVAVLLPWE